MLRIPPAVWLLGIALLVSRMPREEVLALGTAPAMPVARSVPTIGHPVPDTAARLGPGSRSFQTASVR